MADYTRDGTAAKRSPISAVTGLTVTSLIVSTQGREISCRRVASSAKLSTVGSRAFVVADGLSSDVISADSLLTFRRLLKRFFLFKQPYPGVIC